MSMIYAGFDWPIMHFIRDSLRCAFLDVIMPIITLFGEKGAFWILTAFLLLLFKRTRKIGFMLGGAFALGLLIGNITLKPLIARPRPYQLEQTVPYLISGLSDFSFPSGHTMVCFEGATVLLFANRKFGILAVVLGVLVAFSRLYLYVHFPTDVIAGAILGTVCAIISILLVKKYYYLWEKLEAAFAEKFLKNRYKAKH